MLARKLSSLWLPTLVAVLGLALSGLAWGRLMAERQELGRVAVEAVARHGRRVIESQAERRLEALRSQAAFWARFGPQPLEEWRSDTQLLIANFPGLDWIAWVRDSGDALRFASLNGSSPPPSDLREAARAHVGAAGVEGPVHDEAGRPHYRVYLPIEHGPGLGVLVASLDVGALVDPVLRNPAPGYAISVSWGDEQLLHRGEPASRLPPGWRARGEVAIGPGAVWTVSHAPTEATATSMLTPLPHYLLATGVVLSLALAALLHQWRLNRRTIRFLDTSNRALDARIREATSKDAELRLLNQQLERRVAARTEELRRAVEDLEAFNTSVSHDLRSPLGAILTFTGILEEESGPGLDAEARQMLERIRQSAESGLELLEGLLALARAGRGELELEPVDMTELARSAFAETAASAQRTGLDLDLGELPPARVDASLVGDVFKNLFSNAIKYTRRREKARIQVGGRREPGENVYFVADNGVGFDMRFQKKLFGVFERLHAREEYEGTGVGLAMVARIVRRHGGRVWAEGAVDRGACFYFSLPREEEGA
jgi:signal transduction histidine kinase